MLQSDLAFGRLYHGIAPAARKRVPAARVLSQRWTGPFPQQSRARRAFAWPRELLGGGREYTAQGFNPGYAWFLDLEKQITYNPRRYKPGPSSPPTGSGRSRDREDDT